MPTDAVSQGMPAPPPSKLSLFRTLPGRLFILSAISLIPIWVVQQFVAVPDLVETFRKVASLGLRVSIVWLGVRWFLGNRRAFLWRVRRKLILSYVLLGVFPVLLIILFSLVGGFFLHASVAAYLFHEGLDDLVQDIHQIATTSATEIGNAPLTAEVVITRKYALLIGQYRSLSLAVVATQAGANGAASQVLAGAWRHAKAPSEVPGWVATRDFRGTLVLAAAASPAGTPEDERLLIRASIPVPGQSRVVIVDLPIDTDITARLDDRTGARLRGLAITLRDSGAKPLSSIISHVPVPATDGSAAGRGFSLFRRTVVFMDFTDWVSGDSGRVSVSLDAPLGRLYNRIKAAQSAGFADDFMLATLAALGVLFLIVQGSALFFGAALGRQITSAVHELFEGTARIQQGDFAHRIRMDSQDQLGDLATSFNRMSASVEHGLHVQREKQRLDDELRIAREIQQSLLPNRPPHLAGLSIADLCEPAREVGGDYYDFFDLGPRQLGVLVADVSGKGTSAALYMAELKGIMLALSHTERSPRKLLVHVNHLLADHLDNRSFITMTYAVIDLNARTLTCARAGHTPLLVVSNGEPEVIVPSGMVVGLRLPGAGQRFEELLEEYTRPLQSGDAIVLYTDGITEAMDVTGELFSDAALGRVVVAHHHLDANGIRERVLREVKAFVGEAEPHDDMTMVIVKVDGEPTP